MKSAVSIRNFSKQYTNKHSHFALENINLDIREGYITGIVGKNGAGKTTLLKSVFGLNPFQEGTVTILGEDNPLKMPKEKIGFVLSESYLYASMKVKDMTAMVAQFYPTWQTDKYKEYIQRFGIDEKMRISNLSTGTKSKYKIALALSHQADLIVMDEPASGLDPIVRDELLDIFREIMQDEKKTIMFSTHITSDLDKIADYIVMMDNGQILLDMAKDELLDGHRIIKGGKNELKQIQPYLISYTENAYGFEGLTSRPEKFSGMVLEKPNVEEIMKFYVKGCTQHV